MLVISALIQLHSMLTIQQHQKEKKKIQSVLRVCCSKRIQISFRLINYQIAALIPVKLRIEAKLIFKEGLDKGTWQ